MYMYIYICMYMYVYPSLHRIYYFSYQVSAVSNLSVGTGAFFATIAYTQVNIDIDIHIHIHIHIDR